MTDRASASDSPRHSLAGVVLVNRYRLTSLIANGGMAQVWEGHDRVLGRDVAVKLLHTHLAQDRVFVERFHNEAVAAGRLAHPSIVAIFDVCSDAGREAIVMELVRGDSLRQYLNEVGQVDPSVVVPWTMQVADALTVAHDQGVVHRDIKPANILIVDAHRVKVTDFGIAKATSAADLTETGMMMGTAKYLAPEQVEGAPVDGRADIYALGIVLYEAICGSVPFEGDTDTATAVIRLQREPTPPRQLRPDLDPSLEAVMLRALARRPDDRYPTTAALKEALRTVSTELHPVATGSAGTHSPESPTPPNAELPVIHLGQPNQPASSLNEQAVAPTVANDVVPGVAAEPQPGDWADEPHHPLDEAETAHHPDQQALPRRSPAERASSTRAMGLAMMALLSIVALAVAGALFGRTALGNDLADGIRSTFGFGDDASEGFDPEDGVTPPTAQSTSPNGVAISSISSFDPPPAGDGVEVDSRLAELADGNAATSWRTERYLRSPNFGNLKSGVGVVLSLAASTELNRLVVTTATPGWSANVYVSDSPGVDLAAWGNAAGNISNISGSAVVDLAGQRGQHVLIFLTQLASEPTADNRYLAEIAEVELTRR